MELLTSGSPTDTWIAVNGILHGIRAAVSSSDCLLAYSADPAVEIGELLALIWLFGECGGRSDRLAVASPYPASAWIGRVRWAGIDRIWHAVPSRTSERLELAGSGLLEVPQDLCPALHVRKLDGRPTSVCGNRLDRLVLGRRAFVDQCFGRWRGCRWYAAAEAAPLEEPCISSSSDADASGRPSRPPAPWPATTWSSSTPTRAPSACWERDSTA